MLRCSPVTIGDYFLSGSTSKTTLRQKHINSNNNNKGAVTDFTNLNYTHLPYVVLKFESISDIAFISTMILAFPEVPGPVHRGMEGLKHFIRKYRPNTMVSNSFATTMLFWILLGYVGYGAIQYRELGDGS